MYRGANVPELRGKYVFADFVPGRLFYADANEMRSGARLAKVYELAAFTGAGAPITMQQLAGSPRVDLRFGADNLGELYVLSKANGKVWKVTGTHRTSAPPR